MSDPSDHHEHPGTYFVDDRSNQQEMACLTTQDLLMTNSMGGALPVLCASRNGLSEMQRVSHTGGIIRITEPEIVQESSSPALIRFLEMLQCALLKSGHLFAEATTGLTAHLAEQLAKHGCQNVQTKIHALEFQAGSAEAQVFYEDALHVIHTFRPFI